MFVQADRLRFGVAGLECTFQNVTTDCSVRTRECENSGPLKRRSIETCG